jgi:hypothetical protein
MLVLNAAALGIYHLTGHFNFFHVTAILSSFLVFTGWAQVIFRRRLDNWVYRHYMYMCWSYVALVAAAFNEAFVRLAPLKHLVELDGNWVILATQAYPSGDWAIGEPPIVWLNPRSAPEIYISTRRVENGKLTWVAASEPPGGLWPRLAA